MKKIILIITVAFTCAISNSCTQYTPAEDNNFVMMRDNDIPLKQDVVDRQKYIDKPSHVFNLKRFFSELFSPKKTKTTAVFGPSK